MLIKTWNPKTLEMDPIGKFKALKNLWWHDVLARWEGIRTVKVHFSNLPEEVKTGELIFNESLEVRNVRKAKNNAGSFEFECLSTASVNGKNIPVWIWVRGTCEGFWIVE